MEGDDDDAPNFGSEILTVVCFIEDDAEGSSEHAESIQGSRHPKQQSSADEECDDTLVQRSFDRLVRHGLS